MMQRRRILILGLGLAIALGGSMQRLTATPGVSKAAILDDLARAQVIYLGERHDHAGDHRAQADLIQSLYGRNSRLAIAFEMFQRPDQILLDEYLAGRLNEAQLKQKSEYDDRWGYDWENYAPILRFARNHQLPLLALNTPTEVTRQVAQQGLASLGDRDRLKIPPLNEIVTDDPAYRAYLLPFYEQHGGQGNSKEFDRFVEAQILWDETMAEAIAFFARANPHHQIVVVVGRGHILYGYGIPSRVKRRLPKVEQRSLIFNDPEELSGTSADSAPPADYVWIP